MRVMSDIQRSEEERYRNLMLKMEQVEAKISSKSSDSNKAPADLLFGHVLVESVSKIVTDNASLREDSVAVRERLEASLFELRQAKEERKRVEALLDGADAAVSDKSAGREEDRILIRSLKQQLKLAEEERDKAREEVMTKTLHRIASHLAHAS
jgi:hypothetical protein